MKPSPQLTRFEKMRRRGRVFYLMSTALSVAGVITAIQWFMKGTLSWKAIALYALLGAVVAQVDWLVLDRRYRGRQNPKS